MTERVQPGSVLLLSGEAQRDWTFRISPMNEPFEPLPNLNQYSLGMLNKLRIARMALVFDWDGSAS